ncbi:hypothetical protein CDL15_Pgr021635 [Punica granatum]|uniref:Uncharacterized protein n=1 Tax=Punica granatum TaxID=22663 RepID=A0A218WTE2_PUNGR|nr:hypothetical protein CDL15_Pgr021635 [Punica granatum]
MELNPRGDHHLRAHCPCLHGHSFAEQRINRVVLVEEMGVAVTVAESEDMFGRAAELEKQGIELMKSDKGKEMRETAAMLRDETAAAVREGGSSMVALA